MSTEQFQALIQQAKQLSPDERKQLIEYLTKAELEEIAKRVGGETDYLALFGSGRGGFDSAEEADISVREERDSWSN
ncbi:MAG TPA: hypothetical protein VFD48_03155 [Pyrinomonadaceae bacterium]|nr:hypothetical protein [Pyrinomonadaceae bacterium]